MFCIFVTLPLCRYVAGVVILTMGYCNETILGIYLNLLRGLCVSSTLTVLIYSSVAEEKGFKS